MNDAIQMKFKGKRIDNGEWVSGHYFMTPLTDENSGIASNFGWFFLSDGIKRHCISTEEGTVCVIDPETLKRDFGMSGEGRIYGPFTYPEFHNRCKTIIEYLNESTAEEYNNLPLAMRQALEFIYDSVREYE